MPFWVEFCLNDGFSLCSVNGIAIEVCTTNDPAFALPSAISSGDKGDIISRSPYVGKSDIDIARDEAGNPFVGFEFQKVIDPVGIEHVLESFVFEGVVVDDELLERIGEVVLVGEIPILVLEQLVKSFEVLLILGTLLACQAEVLHFLYLEDLPAEDLSDERGLGDGYQIAINFHFHDTIDGLDLYFLAREGGTFLKLRLLEVRSILLHPW